MNKLIILSSLFTIATVFTSCANAEYSVEEGSIFYTEPSSKTKEVKPTQDQEKVTTTTKQEQEVQSVKTVEKVEKIKEVEEVKEADTVKKVSETKEEPKYEHPVYEDKESEIITDFEGHYDQNAGDD